MTTTAVYTPMLRLENIYAYTPSYPTTPECGVLRACKTQIWYIVAVARWEFYLIYIAIVVRWCYICGHVVVEFIIQPEVDAEEADGIFKIAEV